MIKGINHLLSFKIFFHEDDPQDYRLDLTIDFTVRTQAQATMRSIIRRLLKRYKYPPEHAREALDIVMKQVELMCSNEVDVTYDGMMGMSKVAEESAEYR